MNMKETIRRAKEGDNKAKTIILEKYKPLLYSLVRSIYIKDYEDDDLIQIGFESILKAIDKYDLNKGANFGGYLKQAIKNNYYYLIRQKAKYNYDVSLNKCTEDGIEFQDMLEDNFYLEEDIINKEEKEELYVALDTLTEEERELLKIIFTKGHGGINYYANLKGIKYGTAAMRKERAIEKLRKIMVNNR
ncbi:sigma-70 family RNA polymerase sigma factor [Clostridium sp. MSJ-4]|uniref:Sigma-70 family RNA polymerase sigma factor n=1 Tax=Clostridium simiarum TaxID=2841506 RepID=A0ABS6F4I7_9CLOT|nr:sigma-70 family RNA polymerase sigma factor [Clostridium simiarum]MBU5592523.1 sigma-70 family RNA polymerase sigma factor [Clostridium simiarum]